MSKNILCIGQNSYLCKEFVSKNTQNYKFFYITKEQFNLDLTDVKDIDYKKLPAFDVKFDAVVFFAGMSPSAPLSMWSHKHAFKMLSVNTIAPAILISLYAESIKENGTVVFMSSIASKKGSYDPFYAASKASLDGLIASLAVANEFKKIRFNTISLGLVKDSPVYNGMSEEFKRKHISAIPNGELITSLDVIDSIEYLIETKHASKMNLQLDNGSNAR